MRSSPGKRWLRPVVGLALAAALLCGAEGMARVALGSPPERPMVARRWSGAEVLVSQGAEIQPVFQDQYQIPPFAREPAPGTRRLVVLGGSSVHGGGLPVEQEFAGQLGVLLSRDQAPVEVLNLGRPAMDSHSMVSVTGALVEHGVHAQAAVVYLGHNDLGNRTQEVMWARQSPLLARLGCRLDGLRIGFELRKLVRRRHQGQERHEPHRSEFPAMSAAEHARAIHQLRANLGQMVSDLRGLGMGVVLVPAISDVETFGPIGTGCPASMPEGAATVDAIRLHYAPGRTTLAEVEAALEREPECAGLLHLRGKLRLVHGDDGGYADLLAARDLDPVAMRATSAIQAAVREAATDSGAVLVDLPAHVQAIRGTAPPEWFVDEAHLNPRGHEAVALVIAPTVQPLLQGQP